MQEFLDSYIEGALFADLATLEHAGPADRGARYGHVGYPIVMAVSSGIEVLGVLTSTHPVGVSKVNFCHYWRTFLYASGAKRDAAEAIYKLARCGITHNFASKAPTITKGGPHHLVDVEGTLTIDCLALARDFSTSYRNQIRPIAFGAISAASMQGRLDALLASNLDDIDDHRSDLARLGDAYAPSDVNVVGPITQSLDGLNTGATDAARGLAYVSTSGGAMTKAPK